MLAALCLTTFQLSWSIAWGALHVRIRRARGYAREREPSGQRDRWYRKLNPLLFVGQLALSVACLWSDSAWLLEFHHALGLRLVGSLLLVAGLWLTLFALQHLGQNYSPCYDSHLPRTLTTSGPYACIRHPMYLAKLLAGAGTVLFTGSLWIVPSTAYLFTTTVRALLVEDADLSTHLPGYKGYRRRTSLLVPTSCSPRLSSRSARHHPARTLRHGPAASSTEPDGRP